jgi:hypothetical protein
VAASGPSLTPQVAETIRGARWKAPWRVIVVNDAYKLLPWADLLYAADFSWWRTHDGAKSFAGERWTSHSQSTQVCDDKSLVAHIYDLNFVNAKHGKGFSSDPGYIHYGDPEHSGFQAVNLALLMGAPKVVLVGFDYGYSDKAHFFGNHTEGLRQPTSGNYADMARAYRHVETDKIVNATPGSNLKRFPAMELSEALQWDDSLRRDWPESFAATG